MQNIIAAVQRLGLRIWQFGYMRSLAGKPDRERGKGAGAERGFPTCGEPVRPVRVRLFRIVRSSHHPRRAFSRARRVCPSGPDRRCIALKLRNKAGNRKSDAVSPLSTLNYCYAAFFALAALRTMPERPLVSWNSPLRRLSGSPHARLITSFMSGRSLAVSLPPSLSRAT